MAFRLRTLPAQRDEQISAEVKKLALPVIFSNISRTLMSVVDVMMVGRLGAHALAATGMGSMVVWTAISFAIGLRTATQTVSSRRLGQKRYHECGVALRNGQLLAMVFAVPVSIIGFFNADRIISLVLDEPTIVNLAVDYVSVAFLSVVFATSGFVFQGFFTGVERTKIHMQVTIASNMLNVYLNAGMIYGTEGVGKFFNDLGLSKLGLLWTWVDFPALGVRGAAIATVISSAFMMACYFIMLFKKEINTRFNVFSPHLDIPTLVRQIKLTLPQGIQEVVTMTGYVVFYKIVGIIGVIELAATEIVFTILQTSFMPAAGIGQACATLVGKYLGEKSPDKAETSIHESARWSLLVMGSVGIVFIVFPETIIQLFTNEYAVANIGVTGLRLAGLVQFVDAIGMTLWFALSGAGNTLFPSLVESFLVWCFFLPGSYFFGVVFGYGFLAPWIFFGTYISLFAAAMVWKVQREDWKEIEI
jgi:putative MATE family efflux protein